MNRYAPGAIPSLVSQQFMAGPRATVPSHHGMSDYNRQSAAQLPGVQSYRGQSSNQDFRQRDDDRSGNRFAGRRPGNRWQSDTEPELDEPNLDESLVVLDHFNSDLHLVIDADGYGGSVLNDPPGFCFTWAGARATYGACHGKVFYEVHVVEHLPADFGDDHNETDPHVIRLGWSVDSSSFQLGEEAWSYGYGGTGKFSTNNRFTDYGGRFQEGDVIGAMLDLESRPPTISFMKNGTWLGVATPLHGLQVGSKEKALFPHVLSKNCRFKVNFGQMDAWYPPPMGFRYLGHLPLTDRVRGMVPPARKSDCEMIMIVGLPGAGKTTWGINMEKKHPEKRYNIIGTDTLIEKMRVMGLPRKRNYHGRWEVLIDKATKCLNKLFAIAAKRRRNYILDQTNVYGTARRRKMRNFAGFFRIAAVIQPDDPELERRSYKRTHEDGKVVPVSAVLEMKANYSIPDDRDDLFDRIDFVELKRDNVQHLVQIYNEEGKSKPRDDSSQNKFDTKPKPGDQRQQQYDGYKPPGQYDGYKPQSYGQASFDDKNFDTRKREYGYHDQNELAIKRGRQDSGVYDSPKHQYEESDRQPRTQQAAATGQPAWADPTQIKEEPSDFYASSQWSSAGYAQGLNSSQSPSFRSGFLAAPPIQGQSQYGTASQVYGSQFDRDSSRQQASWQEEQKETSLRAQDREPGTAADLWQAGWKSLDDGQGLTSRESGSRDLLYSQREALDRDIARNREGDRDRDSDRDRIRGRDRERYAGGDRERDRDDSWDKSSDYNRTNSGYGSNDRSLQDGGSGFDRTRPDGGYGGYDRSRQDGGYAGFDSTRPNAGYGRYGPTHSDSANDRARLDAGYGPNDRARPDAGYGPNDRARPDAGYGPNDRARLDAGYGANDRARPDAGYGANDRARPDAGYRANDRVGYGANDRARPDAGYGANGRARPDDGYGGYDHLQQGGAYSSTDRTHLDAGYSSNDGTRQGRGYTQDSAATSLGNKGYGASSASVRQNIESDARKSGNQQGYTSEWGLPGRDTVGFSDQIKQEVSVDAFSSGQKKFSQSAEGGQKKFSQSAERFGRVSRFSAASHTDIPQAVPSVTGNIKTEFAADFKDSATADIRKGSSISVVGQPGLKPLIPALERNESDQFRQEKYGADRSQAGQMPAVENDSSQPKRSTSTTSSSKRALPADTVEGRLSSGGEDKKPKSFTSPEKAKPELPTATPTGSSNAETSKLSKEGQDKAGSLPAPDTLEAARDPWNGPSNRPRGVPALMDRFPGPRDDMEPRRPPRGPPHYGSFGGPPRGPMGGPPHGFRGPGPWNQNHPRFGPPGPPRPYFSGLPGRWPRPPR